MHKRHILFLLEYFPPHIGGVETLFTKIVEGVLAEGHQVSIVTCRYSQELPAVEAFADYGDRCTIYRVGSNRFNFAWHGLKKANQICHSKHIDLIHATTFIAALPAGMLRRTTGIPTVLHVHEIYGKLRYRFLGPIMGFFSICLEHIIFRLLRFDKYLCVSNYTKNNLRIAYWIRDDKLLTVYNAIDYDYRKPAVTYEDPKKEYHLEDKKVVLFFGRPGVAKWLSDVIQSIPEVIDTDKSIQYVLIVPQDTQKKVGFIPGTIDESKYEHIMRHYNTHITLLPGAKGELLKAWMQTADLVVLPSHAEGFWFAIAEVCAMGKPLITTNVSAIPEVVCGEVMFVEPGNPGQIASTITAYFNGTAEIHEIPQKIFTRDKCITTVLEVYNQLFKTHKPKAQ